jgi:hypothetical protein
MVESPLRNRWASFVNQQNVATGNMEPQTLRGFIGAARDLGYVITGEEDFLRQQQELVFLWGVQAEAPSGDFKHAS